MNKETKEKDQQVDPIYSDKAYDDAFRTMETKCDDLVIPFVNHMFNESYDSRAIIKRLRNEQFIENGNGSDEKRITDSSFEILFNSLRKRYHIECESKKYDGSILVRIFEYDSQIAIDDSEKDGYRIKFKFPNTGLLLLRSTKSTPESATIELEMPDGETSSYKVPFVRMSDYDIDTIFEKRLYILIPFYIFNYEAELDVINSDEEMMKNFFEIYPEIFTRLKTEVESGHLSAKSFSAIMRLTRKVAYKLTMNREKLQEKVGAVMGGEVLDLPEFRIFDEGKAEERANGIRIFIEDKIEDGIPSDKIMDKLQKKYFLSEEESKNSLNQVLTAMGMPIIE